MSRTTQTRLLSTLGFTATVFFLPGCPQIIGGGASDVPSLNPQAWPSEKILFLIRSEQDGEGALLLAHQTADQSDEDREDGVTGNGSHGPVYRLDPESRRFELVDNSVWDNAGGAARECFGGSDTDTSFRFVPQGNVRGLEFEGRPVEVAGGNAVSVWGARLNPVAAVISSSGGGGVPFLSCRTSSGQHYHQLFSNEDGTPIEKPLRIAVTGNPCAPDACWTRDERFVVYSQRGSGERFTSICMVDVSEITGGFPTDNDEASTEEIAP